MNITFTHHGVERTLTKHPVIASQVKHGQLTAAQAALKPWYLRLTIAEKERRFKLSNLAKDAAIREARDFLNTRQERPNDFAEFIAAKDARKSLTVGQLAAEWVAAGIAFDESEQRTAAAASTLQATLSRCLPYWENKPVAALEPRDHSLFVAWRRQNKLRGEGSRSADLELAALSCLFDWAILTSRVKANPFAARKRFHKAEDVRHCHEFAARSDEDFHSLLAWFWRNPADHETIVAGAWLCFTGLTGLRPEEPAELYRVARLDKMPTDTKSLTPGTIFPMRDGTLKMRVKRSKHGQNPFVAIHAAALQFLERWTEWLQRHDQATPGKNAKWFPGITADDTSILNRRLAAACAELKLGDIKPKGLGRAYYVRCRRSAGIEDSQIAMELGQTTNGKLIRDTYGDPDDLFASDLFDWLPSTGEPAWKSHLRHVPVLTASAELPLVSRYGNDTAECNQDTGNIAQPSLAEMVENASMETTRLTNNRQCSPPENENPLVKQGDLEWCPGTDSNRGPID